MFSPYVKLRVSSLLRLMWNTSGSSSAELWHWLFTHIFIVGCVREVGILWEVLCLASKNFWPLRTVDKKGGSLPDLCPWQMLWISYLQQVIHSQKTEEISSSFSWPVSAVPACQEMPVQVGWGWDGGEAAFFFYVNAQERREQPCMELADRKMGMAPRNGSSASIKFPGWK